MFDAHIILTKLFMMYNNVPLLTLHRQKEPFMSEETDLSSRLQTVIDEIRDVMEKRKERIEELRQEIADIERDNEELERTIAELLGGFN